METPVPWFPVLWDWELSEISREEAHESFDDHTKAQTTYIHLARATTECWPNKVQETTTLFRILSDRNSLLTTSRAVLWGVLLDGWNKFIVSGTTKVWARNGLFRLGTWGSASGYFDTLWSSCGTVVGQYVRNSIQASGDSLLLHHIPKHYLYQRAC